MDDRICKGHKRYERISLTCPKHPGLEWGTRNIDHIGARTVYFVLYLVGHDKTECSCDVHSLEHHCDLPETSPFEGGKKR